MGRVFGLEAGMTTRRHRGPAGEGAFEAVVFDLGGVLVELGGVESMRLLSGVEDDDELWRRWLGCPWVRRFEGGRCSADEFAAGVVSDWELSITPAEYLEEFVRWLVGPLPGADELVRDVRAHLPVACLSNTNAVHWEAGIERWPLLGLFDRRFLSFETGLLKPDPDVFEHVCRHLDADPARIVFLDDNRLNVDAADAAGLRAMRVSGVDDARRVLVAAGVLAGGHGEPQQGSREPLREGRSARD